MTSLHSLQSGKGFVISRRVVNHGGESFVELWLATENGPVCLHSPAQQSVCFVAVDDVTKVRALIRKQGLAIVIEDSDFLTLGLQPVSIVRACNDFQLQQLRRQLKDQSITAYEADIRLPDRFLMERFVYGELAYQGRVAAGNSVTDARVKSARYAPYLSSLSLDIECDEQGSLYSVALSSESWQEVILIPPPTHPQPALLDSSFVLTLAKDERELLVRLEQSIAAADPDLILGWNVKQFDFAVLERRAKAMGTKLKLGRDRLPVTLQTWSDGQVIVDIPGRCVIDGIEALKTMTYHFESFALDAVSSTLLGEGKLIESEDKLSAIKQLYRDDPVALARYNFQDTVLVNRIAAKTRFIDFLILRARLTGLDLGRPGGSVAAFINVYLPHLHRRRYVCGVRPENGGLASPGGYVMSSTPGLYRHVLVLDFKSLYPSIIRTFCIDPLGLAEGLQDPEHAIPGFKGAVFSRDHHFLPGIIANLWAQRDEAKQQQDGPRSQAIKILMNSFYGVLGSGGCPFYDPRLASSITLRGHEIMQTTAAWIREQGHEVIYGDTDSTFVHLHHVDSAAAARQTGEQLKRHINARWQQHLKTEYDLECHLEIEFETHFDTFFMPTIRGAETGSKKRYAGLTYQDDKPVLIFKGLESVRSDWTSLAKTFQETLYTRIFAGEPVEDYIRTLVTSVRAGDHDADLVYSKRLRKPLSEYTRTIPPHVRAAQRADDINRQQNQRLRYQHKTQIRYLITTHGPQTVEHVSAPLDYDHYIEKQIKPIADSILPFVGSEFDTIINEQLGLF
ncbi:DNA polymerase II [Alteromonas sp. ASW11-19]|uniref:DNA polymerase n=1 Tax=Alteromonas salexigens TaxID=2982530 RepID=A0ABT2VPT4_9ALTE|nr:DNA polymerase II [Alteromonas salexigens]MCU7555334.1 DNA polymerase II [Alteromonas salexigens]